MHEKLKQIAVPLGGQMPAAQEVRGSWEGDWRLKSIVYNLAAAVLIGMVVAVGTIIEMLQALISPSHWPEVWQHRRAPQLPLHEWTVADDENAS